jgi:hypothetical protein
MIPRINTAAIALVLVAGLLSSPASVFAGVAKDTAVGKEIPVAWDIAKGGCACAGHEATILAFRDRLAAAPTPEAARALALSQTRLAHKALSRAKWILPFSPTVREANKKLEAYEARIRDARTQADVAAEFGGLMRVASAGDPKIVDAKVEANCHYTTVEIVIIIIGFMMFIYPGFIFMALLC